jgi:hypothetical protein
MPRPYLSAQPRNDRPDGRGSQWTTTRCSAGTALRGSGHMDQPAAGELSQSVIERASEGAHRDVADGTARAWSRPDGPMSRPMTYARGSLGSCGPRSRPVHYGTDVATPRGDGRTGEALAHAGLQPEAIAVGTRSPVPRGRSGVRTCLANRARARGGAHTGRSHPDVTDPRASELVAAGSFQVRARDRVVTSGRGGRRCG